MWTSTGRPSTGTATDTSRTWTSCRPATTSPISRAPTSSSMSTTTPPAAAVARAPRCSSTASAPWSAENLVLGKAIQSALIRRLRGIRVGQLAASMTTASGPGAATTRCKPATPEVPRPALMPAILGESLYLDQPAERAKLRDPRVQTALAAGYFDGITHFLATRRFGIRYSSVHAPDQVAAGGDATVSSASATPATSRPPAGASRHDWCAACRCSMARATAARSSARSRCRTASGPARRWMSTLPSRCRLSIHQWLLKLDVVRSGGSPERPRRGPAPARHPDPCRAP